MPLQEPPLHGQATLDDVLRAVRKVSDEVLELREIVIPISWKQRAAILGGSWVVGALVANLATWLTYHETVLAIFHR